MALNRVTPLLRTYIPIHTTPTYRPPVAVIVISHATAHLLRYRSFRPRLHARVQVSALHVEHEVVGGVLLCRRHVEENAIWLEGAKLDAYSEAIKRERAEGLID